MLKEKYSFKEIIEAQKRPLEEKISLSVEVLRKAYKLSRHNVAIAFSGGKDSTVVADLIERFLPTEFSKTFCIFDNMGRVLDCIAEGSRKALPHRTKRRRCWRSKINDRLCCNADCRADNHRQNDDRYIRRCYEWTVRLSQ